MTVSLYSSLLGLVGGQIQGPQTQLSGVQSRCEGSVLRPG